MKFKFKKLEFAVELEFFEKIAFKFAVLLFMELEFLKLELYQNFSKELEF